MKKTLLFIVLIFSVPLSSTAQTTAATKLRNNCVVQPTDELFEKPIESQHGLKTMTVGCYGTRKVIDSLSLQSANMIPIDEMADQLWLLISKQLSGKKGALSTEIPNWFLTKTEIWGVSMAMVWWDSKRIKWVIFFSDLVGFAEGVSEAKIFYY